MSGSRLKTQVLKLNQIHGLVHHESVGEAVMPQNLVRG
jgi:hypothetical protein